MLYRSAIPQLVACSKTEKLAKNRFCYFECRKSSWLQGILLLFPFKLRCLKPCFFNVAETLPQNKLNSDVARFTIPPTNQTCLPTNQVAKSCSRRQTVFLLFATRSVDISHFTGPRCNSRVWRDFRVILSNQNLGFT